jgi:uncharacterized protein GlcG (DUF336 family)/glucose/arabinose dehydrogenase
MCVLLQDGVIFRYDKATGQSVGTLLDLRPEISALMQAKPKQSKFADERGLLGFAFHPDYDDTNSHYYRTCVVMYTVIDNPRLYTAHMPSIANPDHMTVIAEYRVSAHNQAVNGGVIIAFPCPQFNHNGGGLTFGPDDCLWIGVGDGGGGGDQHGPLLDPSDPDSYLGNAQNLSSPQGKLLRIRLGPNGTYRIPDDNPQLPGALPEIAHWGFRNPWRMFFDGLDLYVADVGQNRFESVKLVQGLGHNYLWRGYEGFEIFNRAVVQYIDQQPAMQMLPIVAYGREMGIAVVGAGIYRGTEIPDLYGKLLIADYSGHVMVATNEISWSLSTVVKLEQRIHSLAFDTMGTPYLLTYNSETKLGQVLKLGPATGSSTLTDADILTIGNQAVAAADRTTSLLRRDQGQATTTRMHIAIIRKGEEAARLIASMDDAWAGSADIAQRKAYTAYAFSSNQNALTTRTIQALSQATEAHVSTTGTITTAAIPLFQLGNSNPEGGIIQFPGGIPLYKNGVLVGAIGVSGDAVDQDEAVARAGAVGYEAPTTIRADTVAQLPYLK